MKRIFKGILITIGIIFALVLILSTSSKMAVRITMLVSGSPVYAVKSNPQYDRGGSETYSYESKSPHSTIYTTDLKYAIYPADAGGNPSCEYLIHKYWIFKIAEPTSV